MIVWRTQFFCVQHFYNFIWYCQLVSEATIPEIIIISVTKYSFCTMLLKNSFSICNMTIAESGSSSTYKICFLSFQNVITQQMDKIHPIQYISTKGNNLCIVIQFFNEEKIIILVGPLTHRNWREQFVSPLKLKLLLIYIPLYIRCTSRAFKELATCR